MLWLVGETITSKLLNRIANSKKEEIPFRRISSFFEFAYILMSDGSSISYLFFTATK